MFDKNVDTKMYQQLTKTFEWFQTSCNIVECLHKYNTQQNESLNMPLSRYVPKFKHYRTSVPLDTRIRCVIWSYNIGYDLFHLTFSANLGGTDRIGKQHRCWECAGQVGNWNVEDWWYTIPDQWKMTTMRPLNSKSKGFWPTKNVFNFV